MGIAKWIMTGLGWSLGGPIGALLGFLIGVELEHNKNELGTGNWDGRIGGRRGGRYHNTGTRQDFDMALLVLVAAVMRCDGVVKKSELDCVKRFLLQNYGEERAKELLLMLRTLMTKEMDVAAVCQQIKTNTDYTTRYHMLDFLYTVAESDNEIDVSEQRLLHTISQHLGVNAYDFQSIYSRHNNRQWNRGQQSNTSGRSGSSYSEARHEDPYKILGITSSVSDEEVKKAYRRLAMKYHPDKVEGLGEEVKKNAETQFRKINEAYEEIKSARGMK